MLNIFISYAAALTFALTAVHTEACDSLAAGFVSPPQSVRPQVWWHWMNGNVTMEGVRKDIEWFDRIGLGGFHVFDANFDTPQIVDKRLAYMTPEWNDAFRLAIRMADSLGMDVTIPSSPGFSSTGGPWVSKEDAMKKVVWREMEIKGGRRFEGPLPEPFTSTGGFQNYGKGAAAFSHYEDIAVIAARLPEEYRSLEELGAKVSSSGGRFTLRQLTDGDLSRSSQLPCGKDGYAWIQYEFPEPQTIRALSIVNAETRRRGHAVPSFCNDSLLVSDNGIDFRTVLGIPVGDTHRRTVSFDGITARYFRLKHKNPKAYYHYTMAHPAPDPEFSEIPEFVIYPMSRVNSVEAKAAFAPAHDIADFPSPPSCAGDVLSGAIDISDKVVDGVLKWDVPEGRWMIFRFGASLTGKMNHPASPEATGLEVDKLDKDAWERHFRNYIDMNRTAAAGMIGSRGITHVLVDSYEAGCQNWTPGMRRQFISRRGYDPFPWLPVLTGAVIGSSQESEAFLQDWRKTIGELFTENYSRLDSLVRDAYGMKGCFVEAHANGTVFPADGMSMKKSAAWPMSEIWIQGKVGTPDRIPEAMADIRESASVAHIYGGNRVAVEAFTAIGMGKAAYSFCPENIKPVADIAMANGANMFVIHDSAHQPLDSHKPGLGLGVYGQWFNRHETWAEQAGPWIDYLARSSFMLRQGKAVADILWYYGEDNNITGLYSHSFPDIPQGYDFDFANAEVLLERLSVRDGKLCTDTGMEYSVLVLDPNAVRMSPAVKERIGYFRSCGITICGPSTSEIAGALAAKGIGPDWEYSSEEPLSIVHRRLPNGEIYWICSPSMVPRKVELSLRASGRKPYLWHPVSGQMDEVSYRFEGGRTMLSLELEPEDAYFIVLREPVSDNQLNLPQSSRREVCAVEGGWDVYFEDPFGTGKTIHMEELTPWNRHDDEWIRHFSGTATYRKTVTIPAHEGTLMLDLTDVKNLAQVYIDGEKVASLWKAPFVVDLSSHRAGDRILLEIRVTNLWVNRLIGDASLDRPSSYTGKTFYGPEDSLKPSGLMGPVRFISHIIKYQSDR